MRHSCLTFQSEFHDCCKLSPLRRLPRAYSISRGIVGGSIQRSNNASLMCYRPNGEVISIGACPSVGLDGIDPPLFKNRRRKN